MSNFAGVTFAEQTVNPSDDAIIRRAILPDGILAGCAITYSGYTLTMAAGALLACGRQFRHPLAQNWAVADATSGFARLVLTIDLTRTATETAFDQITDEIQYASAEDGFADLVQSDINQTGTRYQIEVCKVSLGAGGITGIVSQLPLSRVDGASLNFKVVGGLTQPSDPAANTVWVNTNIKIPSWMLSPTAPAEVEEGAVWIRTGTAGRISFNALKKNGITIFPSACYQYSGGAWVSRPADIYQGEKWQNLSVYLYDNGDEFADVTGSWVATALKRASGSGAKAPTITKENGKLVMTGNAQNGGVVHTANKIDLSGGAVLKFDGALSPSAATGFWATLGVWSEFGATYQDNLAAYHDAAAEETGEITVDISALSGEYYVGVALYGSSRAEMTKVLAE